MRLKKIIAGITAFAIVGSTMLAIPVSARTTTKATDVGLSDLLNMAKMAVELKDNIKLEKQAELLDKFDTNGNGKISINEVLVVAQKIARTDESDIVNEYGTADETTSTEETSETTIETIEITTEETSETTIETTETTTEETSETTTEEPTTEIIEFNPVIEIDGKEYNDGDKFIAEADGIYTVNVTDAENKITVSLTGSQDEDGNSLIRVSENRFEVKADGELTITVTTADGQEKTITLTVTIPKHLKDAGAENLRIKYIEGDGTYYSEEYKNLSNEIGYNGLKGYIEEDEDLEEYWENAEKNIQYTFESDSIIIIGVGAKVKIMGFGTLDKNNFIHDYDTDDEIKFISSNSNKATVDENGVITGIEETNEDELIEIIVMANNEEVLKFNVVISDNKYIEIGTSGKKYAFYHSYYYKPSSGEYVCYYEYRVEGKYVENVLSGEALSLKDLQNQVGAENVMSISLKNFDGTEVKIKKLEKAENAIYYFDETNSTIYYAIANKAGYNNFDIYLENDDVINMRVFDIEPYREFIKGQQREENFIVEFYGEMVANAMKSGTYYRCEDTIVYMTEGETFKLSDIAKVSGIDDPNIKVKNSQEGTSAQNLAYDPLTKTFTVLELTKENSGIHNQEEITLTYETIDGGTREIKFKVEVVRPVFNGQRYSDKSKNYGNLYYTPQQINEELNSVPLFISRCDDYSNVSCVDNFVYTFDNTEMLKKTTKNTSDILKDTLSFADNYTPKAGDTVTITATASRNNANIYSPNIKVTYTIEIVAEYPQISQNPLKGVVFEYPADNKGNQTITFENILKTENFSDDWQIRIKVIGASENVGYYDLNNVETTPTNMTVDARNIKVVKGTNGYYSISGIEVASASKVASDICINCAFDVFDKYGNKIDAIDERGNLPMMYLYIKGEKS